MLGFTFLITFLPNSGHSLFLLLISFETLDAHFTTNILDFPEAYFIRISLSKAFFIPQGFSLLAVLIMTFVVISKN